MGEDDDQADDRNGNGYNSNENNSNNNENGSKSRIQHVDGIEDDMNQYQNPSSQYLMNNHSSSMNRSRVKDGDEA
jgi:hypothetical protein